MYVLNMNGILHKYTTAARTSLIKPTAFLHSSVLDLKKFVFPTHSSQWKTSSRTSVGSAFDPGRGGGVV